MCEGVRVEGDSRHGDVGGCKEQMSSNVRSGEDGS